MDYCPLMAQCFPLANLHHSFLTKEFPKTHSANRNAIYILHLQTLGQTVVRCHYLCCSTAQCTSSMSHAAFNNKKKIKLGVLQVAYSGPVCLGHSISNRNILLFRYQIFKLDLFLSLTFSISLSDFYLIYLVKSHNEIGKFNVKKNMN